MGKRFKLQKGKKNEKKSGFGGVGSKKRVSESEVKRGGGKKGKGPNLRGKRTWGWLKERGASITPPATSEEGDCKKEKGKFGVEGKPVPKK